MNFIDMSETEAKIRIDKWLWAARFFKTRSLASQAVNGGKVHLNGARAKASREVKIGDKVLITKGYLEFDITIEEIAKYRRPAAEARLLYTESQESITKRQKEAEQRRMFRAGQPAPEKKPGKRDRRKIREFTRKG